MVGKLSDLMKIRYLYFQALSLLISTHPHVCEGNYVGNHVGKYILDNILRQSKKVPASATNNTRQIVYHNSRLSTATASSTKAFRDIQIMPQNT